MPLSRLGPSLLLGLNILLALVINLAHLGSYLSPEYLYWPALANLAYPFLASCNLCFLAYWLYQKRRAVYLPLTCLILGLPQFFNTWAWNLLGTSPPPDKLRIMSYNTHYFGPNASKQQAILKLIQEQEPHILCVQEFSGQQPQQRQKAEQFLKEKLQLSHQIQGGKSSLGIYSRYPIINSGLIPFPASANAALFADIKTPKNTLRIYCLHLQSIQLGKDVDSLLHKDQLSKIDQAPTRNKYRNIGSKLKRAFVQRADQTQILKAHFQSSPYPIIIAGDLNDVPSSYAYRQIKGPYQDGFLLGSWGLGTTYAGPLPFLRIDYIFHDAKFKNYGFQRILQTFSDHHALVLDLN